MRMEKPAVNEHSPLLNNPRKLRPTATPGQVTPTRSTGAAATRWAERGCFSPEHVKQPLKHPGGTLTCSFPAFILSSSVFRLEAAAVREERDFQLINQPCVQLMLAR